MNILDGKKAVIFDLDGTIVDSLDMWDGVDERLIYYMASTQMKKKLDNDDNWKKEIYDFRTSSLRKHKDGNIYIEYVKDLMKKYDACVSLKEVNAARNIIAKEYMKKDILLKPNVDVLINKLKEEKYYLVLASVGAKWCVDTYNDDNKNINTKFIIKDIFDLILTKEDVKAKKPDPEIYNKVLDLSGYSKDECLIFEDSLEGVEAGFNAGIDVVNIYDKHSDKDKDKIAELTKCLFNNYDDVLNNINNKPKILVKK